MKPIVHYVYGKTALLSLQDVRWQIPFAHSTVQPLSTAIANLESCTESLRVLDDRSIDSEAHRGTDNAWQPAPPIPIMNTQMPFVAAEQFIRSLTDQRDFHILPRPL